MTEGIAIMTSGGDSAGMNPAVKCAVECAILHGYQPFLIYDGLRAGRLARNPAEPEG